MYNIEGGMWIKDHSHDVTGLRVLEFGNQHIWEHAKAFLVTGQDVARDWYLERGVKEYVSVDINGQDGALPIDLTGDISSRLRNRFDLVTNIGTIEHCDKRFERQWRAFYNAVVFCKIGGVVLHQLPPEKQWVDHCSIRYKDGLGKILAKRFGCDLIEEQRIQLFRLNPDVDYICIALKKKEQVTFDLIPPTEFVERLAV